MLSMGVAERLTADGIKTRELGDGERIAVPTVDKSNSPLIDGATKISGLCR
jgi:hypothetical protein